MPRFLLAVLAAALLILPATAEGQSGVRLQGTVALKSQANNLVTIRTQRQAVALRVPGSMSLIRVGQRVELRGSMLRARGHGSRVLARNVSIASSQPLSPSSSPRADDDEPDDDEVEIKGKLMSLAPLTVASATRSVTCTVPDAALLAGCAVGDFVEITCDRVRGAWVLRKPSTRTAPMTTTVTTRHVAQGRVTTTMMRMRMRMKTMTTTRAATGATVTTTSLRS